MTRTEFGTVPSEGLAPFTDLYELTMMQGYLEADHDPTATFSLFFRKLPPDRGYVVAAGLELAVHYLESLSFGDDALAYLDDLGFSGAFETYSEVRNDGEREGTTRRDANGVSVTDRRSGWITWTAPERGLWARWVLANGLGEVLGLGLAGVVGTTLTVAVGVRPTSGLTLAFAATLVAFGTLEGAIVGYAQWYVLRARLPSVSARSWVGATAAGAFLAWVLGMLPSSLAGDAPSGAVVEPSLLVVLALAAGLGAVTGVVLSAVQWLVLRTRVESAWLWLPANAVAWLVGMPLVFYGISLLPGGAPIIVTVSVVLVTAGITGLVVGAIHGVVLVRLLRTSR